MGQAAVARRKGSPADRESGPGQCHCSWPLREDSLTRRHSASSGVVGNSLGQNTAWWEGPRQEHSQTALRWEGLGSQHQPWAVLLVAPGDLGATTEQTKTQSLERPHGQSPHAGQSSRGHCCAYAGQGMACPWGRPSAGTSKAAGPPAPKGLASGSVLPHPRPRRARELGAPRSCPDCAALADCGGPTAWSPLLGAPCLAWALLLLVNGPGQSKARLGKSDGLGLCFLQEPATQGLAGCPLCLRVDVGAAAPAGKKLSQQKRDGIAEPTG